MATKRSNRQLRFSENVLREYLSPLYNADVEICEVWRLGSEKAEVSYVIEFTVNGVTKQVVLETMRSEGFGHDYLSDRAQVLLWQHSTFNKLPCHVRSLDVGAFTVKGEGLKSLGDCGEFFILTELVDGKLYHFDLERLKENGQLSELDEQRCLALSDYLVEIHRVKRDAPWLYVRRARELAGHGECVMGLLDSYPSELDFVSESNLIDIERDCVIWRWRLLEKLFGEDERLGNS